MRPHAPLPVLALALVACTSGPPPPAALDTRTDACAWCRMTVSDRRFAAQLVAPGEEPRFFDDIGCLTDYLRGRRDLTPNAAAYVTDIRSGDWVSTARATFVRCSALTTPMASGLAAYADSASRTADQATAGCVEVQAAALLPPALAGSGAP